MSIQESVEKPISTDQDYKQSKKDFSGAPIYFAVSPLKLFVMSIYTAGIYELYWFYKNWVLIKERASSDIRPFWRASFAAFYCIPLFIRVQASAAAVPLKKSIAPGLLGTGWIIFTILAGVPGVPDLPDRFRLISFFAVVFLLPVQALVNELNEFFAPGHDKNDKFSGWNIFGVVVGGLVILLVLSEVFHGTSVR